MARPMRYLILPAQGLQSSIDTASAAATTTLTGLTNNAGVATMRTRLNGVVKATAKAGATLKTAAFKLVASLNEDGVKLVESTPEMMAALRFEHPGLRAVPEVFYSPAVSVVRLLHRVAKVAGASPAATVKKLVVTVVDAAGSPVADVKVIGFTDFATNTGTEGFTSSTGSGQVAPGLDCGRRVRVRPRIAGEPIRAERVARHARCWYHCRSGGRSNRDARHRTGVQYFLVPGVRWNG